MKRIVLGAALMAAALVQHLQAGALEWNIPRGYRLEVVRTAAVQYFINGRSLSVYDERNIADLVCLGHDQGDNRLRGSFTVYQRAAEEKVFTLKEQHSSNFTIRPGGGYVVPEEQYMPNLRNIPELPPAGSARGAQWQCTAELGFNCFSRPFKLNFPVRYSLRSVDNDVAMIDFIYEIDMDLRMGSCPPDFPIRIVGSSAGVILWQVQRRVPVKAEEEYRMVFMMGAIRSGVALHEYRMKIATDYTLYPPLNALEQEKQRRELQKALPEDEAIDVDRDERGLVLRLGEVFFDFDSSALAGRAKQSLDRIAGLIRQSYAGREIIIEGHTDSIGERTYNMRLSGERARSVAEYLAPLLQGDKCSFRGLGPDAPLADNATPEGRKKNRRVEIIIKLN
jgi:outer membrane protein OmpA-like peptidoglycan-associated protein